MAPLPALLPAFRLVQLQARGTPELVLPPALQAPRAPQLALLLPELLQALWALELALLLPVLLLSVLVPPQGLRAPVLAAPRGSPRALRRRKTDNDRSLELGTPVRPAPLSLRLARPRRSPSRGSRSSCATPTCAVPPPT